MDVISSKLLTTLLLITTVLFTHPLRAAEDSLLTFRITTWRQETFTFECDKENTQSMVREIKKLYHADDTVTVCCGASRHTGSIKTLSKKVLENMLQPSIESSGASKRSEYATLQEILNMHNNGKNKDISSNSDETSLTCSIKQFLAQHDEPETPITIKHNGRTTEIFKKNINDQQLFAFVDQIKR